MITRYFKWCKGMQNIAFVPGLGCMGAKYVKYFKGEGGANMIFYPRYKRLIS